MIDQFHIQNLVYDEEYFKVSTLEGTISQWMNLFSGTVFDFKTANHSVYQFLFRY